MRTFSALSLVATLLLTFVGTPPRARAVTEFELLVVVNVANQARSLDRHELEALFTAAQTRWIGGVPVVPLNLPNGNPGRDAFDRVVLGLGRDQVGRFWIDRRVRGMGMPPKQVPDPNIAVRVVERINGAITYVPSGVSVERVRVVARVRQGRVMPP